MPSALQFKVYYKNDLKNWELLGAFPSKASAYNYVRYLRTHEGFGDESMKVMRNRNTIWRI